MEDICPVTGALVLCVILNKHVNILSFVFGESETYHKDHTEHNGRGYYVDFAEVIVECTAGSWTNPWGATRLVGGRKPHLGALSYGWRDQENYEVRLFNSHGVLVKARGAKTEEGMLALVRKYHHNFKIAR